MSTWKSLSKLKPYLGPHIWLIVASGLLAIPLAGLRFSPVPVVKFLVDDLLVSKDASKLYLFPLLIIGIYVVNFFVRFGHYYLIRIVIARVNENIKKSLFGHLMGLSSDYFTAQTTGQLISRVGTDPQHIDNGIASINVMIREPFTLIFLMGYAFYLDWQLTLITLGIVPLLAWLFSMTARKLKKYIAHITEQNAQMFSTLQESFSGIRVVHTFGLENFVRDKFKSKIEKYTHYLLKTAVLQEAAHPAVELFSSFALAAMLFFGGSRVLSGAMTTGEFFSFLTAFMLMVNPMRMLSDVNLKVSQAAAAMDRINEVLAWKTHVVEPAHATPLQGFDQGLAFDQVRFAYPDLPSQDVLKGISFSINKGQTLAIVGESGTGKSSLISLIPRIFDVTGGQILIDGKDIRESSLESLRSMISVVSQDVFLFNDTVATNIRCGRLDASDEEVREAARRAHAHDFVTKMPNGFDTLIGERGQKLSGGERQRLSIARAFLRGSPILILDEATSSLDSSSEKIVQAALDDLMKDRTTLIIAHRLTTIRNADQILVMKEGQIVESGNHDELIGSQGEYARLSQLFHQ